MVEKKSNHEKKKSQALRLNVIGSSGCVLGGVVLLGGGLAVAGLMAAFTVIKSRNSAGDDQKTDDPAPAAAAEAAPSEKIHDGAQGLSSVLQYPTTAAHQNYCLMTHATQTIGITETHMDSRELVSAHDMDLGDKPVPIMDWETEDPSCYQQDILESNESCNEILNNEETSLPATEIMIKNDPGENLRLVIEKIEVKKEGEPAEIENLTVEENLTMQSEESEEEDDDGSEEHVMDKEEVSCQGEVCISAAVKKKMKKNVFTVPFFYYFNYAPNEMNTRTV